MEKVKIVSLVRNESGKKISAGIRKEGFIPAVIYSKGFNLSIKLPRVSLKTLQSINFSENTIIDMDIEGADDSDIKVLVKDIQYNPLTEEVIHIDFMKISMEEKRNVNSPVVLRGECKGVKEGGTLEQMLWEIEIEALPMDIPEKIEVDISSLGVGDSIHIKNLSLKDSIKVLEPPEETIVTVVAKNKEEEETPVEEAPEGKEPEVTREKEKSEEKS